MGGSEATEHFGIPKTSLVCEELDGDDPNSSELLSEVGWINGTIARAHKTDRQSKH